MRNEELRAAGVLAGVSHSDNSFLIVTQVTVLAGQCAAGIAPAVAARAATLYDERWYDAMEHTILVQPGIDVLQECSDGARVAIAIEFQNGGARIGGESYADQSKVNGDGGAGRTW